MKLRSLQLHHLTKGVFTHHPSKTQSRDAGHTRAGDEIDRLPRIPGDGGPDVDISFPDVRVWPQAENPQEQFPTLDLKPRYPEPVIGLGPAVAVEQCAVIIVFVGGALVARQLCTKAPDRVIPKIHLPFRSPEENPDVKIEIDPPIPIDGPDTKLDSKCGCAKHPKYKHLKLCPIPILSFEGARKKILEQYNAEYGTQYTHTEADLKTIWKSYKTNSYTRADRCFDKNGNRVSGRHWTIKDLLRKQPGDRHRDLIVNSILRCPCCVEIGRMAKQAYHHKTGKGIGINHGR